MQIALARHCYYCYLYELKSLMFILLILCGLNFEFPILSTTHLKEFWQSDHRNAWAAGVLHIPRLLLFIAYCQLLSRFWMFESGKIELKLLWSKVTKCCQNAVAAEIGSSAVWDGMAWQHLACLGTNRILTDTTHMDWGLALHKTLHASSMVVSPSTSLLQSCLFKMCWLKIFVGLMPGHWWF